MQDVPIHCKPGDDSMYGAFMNMYSSIFSFDSCAKYHEAVLIHPLWEVAPSEVIVFFDETFRCICQELCAFTRQVFLCFHF